VTLFGRCKRHERVKNFRMHFRIGPISRNAGPFGAQALRIDIGVLDDKCSKPIRMRRDYAKSDRPAVVMKVEGVSVDLSRQSRNQAAPGLKVLAPAPGGYHTSGLGACWAVRIAKALSLLLGFPG
jgi:hypothetical protein